MRHRHPAESGAIPANRMSDAVEITIQIDFTAHSKSFE